MTHKERLAQQVNAAIGTKNEDQALRIVIVEVVGTMLDTLQEIADAQKRLAEAVENVVLHKATIHIHNAD